MHKWIQNWSITGVISLMLVACGGGGGDSETTTTTTTIPTTTTPVDTTASHQVLAFNDLGMHCADLDYSTFVILPPFNVVHTQVIERGSEPRILDISGVDVRYQGVMDTSGTSINTTSQNLAGSVWKTNFWDVNPDTGNKYVFDLFGLDPQPDEGLAFGQTMPGILNPYMANDPQDFNHYDPDKQWFAADGIPILPIDDSGQLNAYPMMKISASDKATGTTLADLDVVLPVASEADCQNCHALGEVAAPVSSTIDFMPPDDINDPNSVLQAAKHNILALHDAKQGTDLLNQTPVLCASCHYSAALDLAQSGPNPEQSTHDKMSVVMHSHHGQLTDPATGDLLFPSDGTLEETCYQCHPGKITKCLRGAMGSADIVCQDCHGGMLAVGSETREPWLEEPRCESCHTGDALSNLAGETGVVVNSVDSSGNVDNIRLRQTYKTDPNVDTVIASNKRFAEGDGTLYRNSLGHGGVACEACHGSTHAIWPTTSANDNQTAITLQGHSGTITECAVCHTSVPLNLEGPHGMHVVDNDAWELR
ncbi:MAG: hypothetical protein PVG22_18185, partial [Chromatiales bacterium]